MTCQNGLTKSDVKSILTEHFTPISSNPNPIPNPPCPPINSLTKSDIKSILTEHFSSISPNPIPYPPCPPCLSKEEIKSVLADYFTHSYPETELTKSEKKSFSEEMKNIISDHFPRTYPNPIPVNCPSHAEIKSLLTTHFTSSNDLGNCSSTTIDDKDGVLKTIKSE